MKKKIICFGIVSIFLLMGLTATASKVSKVTDDDNRPPIIIQCYQHETRTGIFLEVRARDPDGDNIRFCLDIDKDGVIDKRTGYVTEFTRIFAHKTYQGCEYKQFQNKGHVFVVVEDGHGAQSDWVDPASEPRSKSIDRSVLNIFEKIFSKFPLLQQLIHYIINL